MQRSERLLPRSDAEAAAAVHAALTTDGVSFLLGAKVEEVVTHEGAGGGAGARMSVRVTQAGAARVLPCDALLVATGRRPNVEELGLERAGVEYSAEGVVINATLQTSNPDVYALGDAVAGIGRFTHLSGEMAKVSCLLPL